jgi:hypothetical protein
MLSLVVALLCFVIAQASCCRWCRIRARRLPRRQTAVAPFPRATFAVADIRRRTPALPRPARGSGRRRSAASASRPAQPRATDAGRRRRRHPFHRQRRRQERPGRRSLYKGA